MSTMDDGRAFVERTMSWVRAVGLLSLVMGLWPTSVAAQGVVSAGVLVITEASGDGSHVGPALSAVASFGVIGVPLFLEAGAARTDFTSLGQDYHDDHYFFALGVEWFPASGTTRLGLRLGLGAYGEYQTVETNPPSDGGDNWIEAVIPGLVLERDLGEGRRLNLTISDFVLGPFFAVLDPEEYGVEHRFRVMLGVSFQ